MKVMVYDTETNGLPLWSQPSEHPGQPHLVQYTAVLFSDQTRQEMAFDTMLVRPEGWSIPPELTAIHKITMEQAMDEGVPLRQAVSAYQTMRGQSDLVSGYNVAFDERIMRIAMLRCGMSKFECDAIQSSPRTHDVARQVTPLCRLPPTDKMMAAGRKTFKQPKLAEAMRVLLNEEMDDAHDSRADVFATMRLFLHLNGAKQPA